ncbi:hypothetical protein MKZ38_004540 [Zalerion maritima]|uniref:FAS1 domain-containing protein n=1 Tax=Zalerion maritima TaxID=339359 RepID=A0AAD5RME8_9PEZI|nr:hypothetical protein MKZ38_004540 [Zalerion maritima]
MHSRALLLPLLSGLATAQSLAEALSSESDLSALAGVLEQLPDVASQLGSADNITILAPSNSALGDISADADVPSVLSYHVLKGNYESSSFTAEKTFVHTMLEQNVTGGQVVEVVVENDEVMVNGDVGVVKADISFDAGTIHIISSVLSPPPNISAALASTDDLSSLASALANASLVSTVASLSDITVFAPNNDAFASIGDALGGLGDDEIAGVLTYHVVQGTVGYGSLLSNTSLETVEGGDVRITVTEAGDVMVNGAKVVVADVLVSNGVVHVIDAVLMPNSSSSSSGGGGGGEGSDDEEDGDTEEAAAPGFAPAMMMAAVAALAVALVHGL